MKLNIMDLKDLLTNILLRFLYYLLIVNKFNNYLIINFLFDQNRIHDLEAYLLIDQF